MIAVIREAALVIIVALALAGAGYMLRPAVMPTASDGTATNGGGEEESVIGVIPLESARRHFEKGTALFADARPERAYRFGHIPGAVNLDPSEVDTWSGDFFSRISPDQLIITYCDGEHCALSLELAEKLTWMGYEKVFYLKDGWKQWKAHQLPMEQESE